MTAPQATSAALATSVAAVARAAYVARQLLARRTILAVRRYWAQIDQEAIRLSWQRGVGPAILRTTADAQSEAAAAGDAAVAAMLAAQGDEGTAAGTVAPEAFAGVASDGCDLASLLELSNLYALRLIGVGQQPTDALVGAGKWLDLVVGQQVVDAGRVASGVAIASRPWVTGWIRMLSPPSCSRCIVLAGKWFGWNEGFERHPRCDCLHIPASEDDPDDLRTNPDTYFRSLSRAEQDSTFGKAGAQAIRDGADISQVVNARQGMTTASIGGRDVSVTTAGTTKRGYFAYVQRAIDEQRGQATDYTSRNVGRRGFIANYSERRVTRPRLMPEQIYRIAGDDRAEAVRLLISNGYVVDGRTFQQLAEAASGVPAFDLPR